MSKQHMQSSTQWWVRVTPGSKHPTIGGLWQVSGGAPHLRLAVAAKAVDGRANRAVCEALAQACGVARRNVSIIKGETSRSKLVRIDGNHEHLEQMWAHFTAER